MRSRKPSKPEAPESRQRSAAHRARMQSRASMLYQAEGEGEPQPNKGGTKYFNALEAAGKKAQQGRSIQDAFEDLFDVLASRLNENGPAKDLNCEGHRYRVRILDSVQRYVGSLDEGVQKRLIDQLVTLAAAPIGAGRMKLTDNWEFRTQLSRWRIVYRVNEAARTVLVTSVRDVPKGVGSLLV